MRKQSRTRGPVSRPRAAGAVSILALLAMVLPTIVMLTGCGPILAPAGPVARVSSVASPPDPGFTPTLTDLPTVPAVQPSQTIAISTSTATATATTTPTPSPSLTATPSATPTAPSLTPSPTITGTVGPTPTPQFSPTPLPTAVGAADWLNVLLIGLDSTEDLRTQNTDVIIVAGLNKKTKQVSLLSIPRDLWVYIPTYGWSRINIAHKRGYAGKYPGEGPGLLMRTIEMNLGIPIDHWARIDFQGFTKVVDDLGGIDITVSCPVNLQYKPSDGGRGGQAAQILQPGVYHMDGATALRYVRTRRGGSDFDRARRQQQFLKAMWDQRKNLSLGTILSLFGDLSKSIKTDLSIWDLEPLIRVALDLKPQSIRSRYIGANQTTNWTNADGWQVLLPRYDKIQQVVADLYAAPPASGDQAATDTTRVQVRNGTSRAQLAEIAADQLHWAGVNVVDTGPADNNNYQNTRIIVFNDQPQEVDLLSKVLNVKAENVVHSDQPGPGEPADIQVILGNDYDPCR